MLKEFIECGNALVAVLNGDIDQYGAAYMRSKIDIEFELSSMKNLVFDLSGVEFMDSAGIGLITGRKKNAEALGGKIAIAGADKKLMRILDLSGITGFVPVYSDYRKAVEAMLK